VSRFDPVLMDLDGTVIDSVALIRESHRHAVTSVLGRELPDERLVANVGRPLRDQMRAFSPEHADDLLVAYRTWNHANTARLLAPYAGMDDLLRALVERGTRLGVVTSKSRPVVDLAFDVLPLGEYFDVVIAAEDTAGHKPGPEPVEAALRALGAAPGDACFVGDSPFDLRSGRAAGCATIAVTWGFFGRGELAAEEPDLIVDTVDELAAVLLEP
jgi:pyrophosphatase PpaX